MSDVLTQKRFDYLYDLYKKETCIHSDMGFDNLHYKEIKSYGKEALPFIFNQMEKEVRFLFEACEEITGINLITKEMRGKVKEMNDVWVEWGKENGYLKKDI